MWFKKSNIIILIILIVLPFNDVIAGTNVDLETGIRLFDAEKYSEAKKIFTGITDRQPDTPEAWYYLGRVCLIDDDFDVAIKNLKRAVKQNQKSSEYQYWLGTAYKKNIGKVSKIKTPFIIKNYLSAHKKAVELDANNIQARLELMMYYLKAPAFGGGSKRKAIEQAEEIKKRDPKMGHYAYANIYRDEGNNKLAEKEYIALVETDPKNFQYRIEYARFYIDIKDYEKAYIKLKNIILDFPEKSFPYYSIGQIGFESQNYTEEAEKYMLIFIDRISSIDPESEIENHFKSRIHTLHFMLGKIYEKNGKKDLAKKEYETAVIIDPDYKEAKEALRRLN